jgi:ABC-type Fe3+-siderophore transport system permease subunit
MTLNTSPKFFQSLGIVGRMASTLTDEDSIKAYSRTLACRLGANLVGAILLCIAVMAVGGAAWLQKIIPSWLMLSLEVFCFVSVAVCLWFSARIELMVPVRQTDACEKALACVGESTQAAQWRDLAVAQGRELRMFDLTVMLALARQEASMSRKETNEELCSKLHRIDA